MKLGPCMAWWGSVLMAVAAVMAAPRGEVGSVGLETVLLQSKSPQSGLTKVGGATEPSVDKLRSRVQALLTTFGDNDTVPENVKEALALIRELVEELRSKLQEPITSESSALQALAEGFQACVDVATGTWPAMRDGDPALQAEMADARNKADAHHACRGAEVQHRIEVVGQTGACRTFQSAIEEAHSVKPVLTFGSMDDFFTNKFDVAAFTQKAEACETGVETYQNQIASCKEQQKAFEMATCHWHSMAVQADITCKNLQVCRDEEGSALSDACAKAEERVERWSAETVAIDHIECLLGELGTGRIKAAAVRACAQESNTTNSVNLTCPNVTFPIDEQQCKSLAKPADIETVPGAAPWVGAQYRGKPWFSNATNNPGAGDEISSLVACELPDLGNTPSTTPAPDTLKFWTTSWHYATYNDLDGGNPQTLSVRDELWSLHGLHNPNIATLAAGSDAVYLGIYENGYSAGCISRKKFDGSPVEILVDGTKPEDPAYEIRDILVGESKLYWHTDSRRRAANHKPTLLWRANFDGSDVEPLMYEEEWEELRHSTDERRTHGHEGAYLSADGESLYFARMSHSKNEVYLYRKPVDGAGLSFVKALSPKVINGQDAKIVLDKSDIYVGYLINWGKGEWGFARCSYAAEDAWPCPEVFAGRSHGDGSFSVATDYYNNKLFWKFGTSYRISDMDGTNIEAVTLKGSRSCCGVFSIGGGPSLPP